MTDPGWRPPTGAPSPSPPSSPSLPPANGFGAEGDRVGTIPSVWLRVGARLFDELLLAVPTLAISLPYLSMDETAGVLADLPKWAVIVTAVIPLVYEFVFIAWRGATPGKSLVGIAVRGIAGGGVRPYQAGLRVLIPALGSIVALAVSSEGVAAFLSLGTPLVYASVMWDPRHRGLHDKAAGTIVLRTR